MEKMMMTGASVDELEYKKAFGLPVSERELAVARAARDAALADNWEKIKANMRRATFLDRIVLLFKPSCEIRIKDRDFIEATYGVRTGCTDMSGKYGLYTFKRSRSGTWILFGGYFSDFPGS